jgi:hypothetical protein
LHRDTTDHARTVARGPGGGDAGAARVRAALVPCTALLPWLAACSSLPSPTWPPFTEQALRAEYRVPVDGRIRLPHSDPRVTVLELHCEPPALREEFAADGSRRMVFVPGSSVQILARLRSYAHGDAPPAGPAQLLPGATSIEPWSPPTAPEPQTPR